MAQRTAHAPEIAELHEVIETWRREARQLTYEIKHPVDLEWLNGRIAALSEVLGLLDGAPPPIDVSSRLLGA